jgi:hypothetical protein
LFFYRAGLPLSPDLLVHLREGGMFAEAGTGSGARVAGRA